MQTLKYQIGILVILLLPTMFPSSVSASPKIFWASDPVSANETVLVTGDDLATIQRVVIARLTDTSASFDSAGAAKSVIVSPIQLRNSSLKFVVPTVLGTGVYRYELIGGEGRVVGYLNAPTVYWVQGNNGLSASPGGWIRIFGRNVARTTFSMLSVRPTQGGDTLTLRTAKWSLWSAAFTLPRHVTPGVYELKLWNGQGDRRTWRSIGTIDVRAPSHAASVFLNAKAFGATGDGHHDDTNAIRAALRILEKKGGGTLYFPRGRYLISGELVLPANTTVKGKARKLVSLNWTDFSEPPPALLSGQSDFTIEDLTLYASRFECVVSGGFSGPRGAPSKSPAKDITIKNIAIRASGYRGHITATQAADRFSTSQKRSSSLNGPVGIRLSGANVSIINSDVYVSGSSFLLFHPRGAYIANNRFANGRGGWYSITGADGVIFENNVVTSADNQSAGGSINTLSQDTSFSRNVYFGFNKFSLMQGWDRESVTSDGPGGYYYGPVQALGTTRLLLTEKLPNEAVNSQPWRGAGVFVVDGRGTGEFAAVVSYENGGITLDRPFSVLPDNTSTVAVVAMQENYIMVNNAFTDAGVAIQFYGTSVDHVVVGNTSARTLGFITRGLVYHQFQPSWYVQFINNKIIEGNTYDIGGGGLFPSGAVVGVYGQLAGGDFPPITRGVIVRDNELGNNSEIEISGGASPVKPGVEDVIVEGNKILRSDVGIVVDAGVRGAFLRYNSFERVMKHIERPSR